MSDDDLPKMGECAGCGIGIYHGEWHVSDENDDRKCAACTDLPQERFKNASPIAGVDGHEGRSDEW